MHGKRPRRALTRPNVRRLTRIAAPSLVGALLLGGVALAAQPGDQSIAQPALAASSLPSESGRTAWATTADVDALPVRVTVERADSRTSRPSRAAGRPGLPRTKKAAQQPAPKPTVVGRRYASVALNVRTKADPDSRVVTVLTPASRVKITGTVQGQWRQIVHQGRARWVKNRYLVQSKPKPRPAASSAPKAAVTKSPCGNAAVERGLTGDAILVHRSVCSLFPGVTSFGGVRADALGEHGSGRALDIMVPNSDLGWRIAKWARSNAKQLGVSQVIHSRRIWTVQRSSEGWRGMADRGSVSANHEDHVHVTVYGSAAG